MGPDGMGPMTGRGAGFCAGSGTPGYMNPYGGRGAVYGRGYGYGAGFGAGLGRGVGRGMGQGIGWGYGPGWRRGYAYAPSVPISPELEKQDLEREASFMEEELKAIRKRIEELGTGSAD